jgi:hypothetical protein
MANDLVISVGASIRDLERQMKTAAQVAEKAADDIEAKFKKVNPAVDFGLGVLKGAIAAISFDQITRGIIAANKEISSFGDTAKRVGLDVAKFQELRLAGAREGVDGKSFDAGIEGLAEKLNEARQKEGDLTKFLDENNVKYRDRKGEIISTNEALSIAADLISRAATEQDKIKIAEAFGLPKDFVPLLEGGAAALAQLGQNAREAGGILDAEVIAKAKEFDSAWTAAWASFEGSAKSGIVSATQGLIGLIAQADGLAKSIANSNAALSLNNALRSAFPDSYKDYDRKQLQIFRQSEIANSNETPSGPLTVDVKKGPTKTTSLFGGGAKKGGGGGKSSGKSDEEQAQDRLEKYIETLMRQNSVLDAEVATFGKSNAEKRAAVELAKAQVDLSKLDDESRQKIIAGLTKEIELSEQKRTQLKSLKDAQDGLRDAQKYFGDAAVDALEDLIVNGAKAQDVVNNLAKSLAKAAIQAAFMGSGPLASIFGTAGQNGNVGGLFGAIFSGFTPGRATGGPVNPGQSYKVGERGPERFVPTVPGKIIPNNRLSGGSSVAISIDVRGATGNQEVQRMVSAGVAQGMAAVRQDVPGIVKDSQRRFA